MNLFDLTGKTAVVVGGTSTLGAEMAVGLAGHGAAVAIIGRNMQKAREVEERIENSGGQARCFEAKATSKQDLERVLADIIAWRSSIDVLLNSVGVNSNTPFLELKEEEWDEIISVNAKSVLLSCQVFGRYMVERGQGGSIINVSSVSSDPPLSKVLTYSASKAAVNNLTKYLARELAPHRIRVNAIIPGFFPAVQNRKILTKERIEAIMGHTPVERFGEPYELQGAAVWLASEAASSFVTGALIRVDGGFGAVTI